MRLEGWDMDQLLGRSDLRVWTLIWEWILKSMPLWVHWVEGGTLRPTFLKEHVNEWLYMRWSSALLTLLLLDWWDCDLGFEIPVLLFELIHEFIFISVNRWLSGSNRTESWGQGWEWGREGLSAHLLCCILSFNVLWQRRKWMETLIADLVTMVMCRLLSFMRGLNGLEAPFKMLACEEVAKHVLTACFWQACFQVCRDRVLEGWVSKAYPAFTNGKETWGSLKPGLHISN